jgi:hypothetical protein
VAVGTADRLDERLRTLGRLDEEVDELADGGGRRCPPHRLQVPPQRRNERPDRDSADPEVIDEPQDAQGDAGAGADRAQRTS